MNISFIGFGRMAKAIASGLINTSKQTYQLRASAPSLPRGMQPNGIETDHDNLAVLPTADVLILAVKPMHMPIILTEISAHIPSHCLVISIATGLSLSWFEQYLPHHAILRAMPNIAAIVQQSATPLLANAQVSLIQRQTAEILFSNIGTITWVQQEQALDYFTALSGSGPAYVFTFMNAMIDAAIALGLSEETAKLFTLQTVQGAVSLASLNQQSLLELRDQVTSPGGTTEAALRVLQTHHFDQLIFDAMNAAAERSKQLGTTY